MKNVYEFAIEQKCYLSTKRIIAFFLDKNNETENNISKIKCEFSYKFLYGGYPPGRSTDVNEVSLNVDEIQGGVLFSVIQRANNGRIALVDSEMVAKEIIQKEKNKSGKDMLFDIVAHQFYSSIEDLSVLFPDGLHHLTNNKED